MDFFLTPKLSVINLHTFSFNRNPKSSFTQNTDFLTTPEILINDSGTNS